jgi:hypothetical protein
MLGCRTLIRSWNMWKNRAPNRLTIVTTSGTYSRGLFWCGLIAVAGVTVASCAHKAAPVPDAMHIMVCDTTPMKPLGRRVEIPEIAPRPNQAGLTGSIVQAETGDAIEGALISLRPINQPPKPVPPFRYTNATGGFSFDDLEAALTDYWCGASAKTQTPRRSTSKLVESTLSPFDSARFAVTGTKRAHITRL